MTKSTTCPYCLTSVAITPENTIAPHFTYALDFVGDWAPNPCLGDNLEVPSTQDKSAMRLRSD